jgi:hypothetical protein
MSRRRNTDGLFTKQESMYMSFKKLALTSAVAAAMGVAAVPSQAMVYGVAGEALLVPLVLNDAVNSTVGNTNTYVVLRLPTIIGSDFVLNNYTTPNIRAGVPPSTSVTVNPELDNVSGDYGWKVHWTWFDPQSKNPVNETCEGSGNDVLIWTTDQSLLDIQQDIDRGLEDTGDVPFTFCGDSGLSPAGYVVFQTAKGADGLEADFALEGTAYITDNNIAENTVGLLSVPVIPMADGEDPIPANETTSPRIGANEVVQFRSDGELPGIGNGSLESPVVVSPVATGIRMNDGNPATKRRTSFAGGVQGDFDEPGGYSMHVLWFDRNNAGRGAAGQSLLWDEHEKPRSLKPPIDHELNVLLYNASLQFTKPALGSNPWDAVDPNPASQQYVDLTKALAAAQANQDYISTPFTAPQLWDFTIMGFMEYILREEGDEKGGPGGTNGSNASAIAFEAQEDDNNSDAWSQHLMTVRGFR